MRAWHILILCFLFTLFTSLEAHGAATISVTGGWSKTINSNDLTGGAGTGLTSTYQSPSPATWIDVTTTDGAGWRVDVRRVDSAWSSQVTLWVSRESDGTGSGTITGGTAYQEVTSINLSFFSGTSSRTNIRCRYKIEGMSIQVDPATYSTSVIYSIMDL